MNNTNNHNNDNASLQGTINELFGQSPKIGDDIKKLINSLSEDDVKKIAALMKNKDLKKIANSIIENNKQKGQ
ncbi:MAG: hypothetical protein E7613_01035 [Ruminococcaceae bacterium]|nr:hypothetical protein [Oscillospiraceae bacterium]